MANASVGEKKPGTPSSPVSLAARITTALACGVTTSLPPALAISATWADVITVPAPISSRSPNSRASRAMLSIG